jgi:hypothetical protein
MGVILLTILFGGVAGYRMIRPTPSAISPVEVPAAPVDPAPAVAESPVVPDAPVAAPQTGSDVPPPPPSGGASRRARRSGQAAPAEKVILVDQALAIEGAPVPLTELKSAEAPKPEPPVTAAVAAPLVTPAPATAPETQTAASNDAAPKPETHGKKIGNAFRRLLHIPKKDAQQETLKQP